ncbi:unnamed protein product [Rotaria socialis]|uniref:CS domain-containing protein n=1 Tax=Rotaria socialis TaxID=392032 RepID=A0A818EK34_9BILA|nr:unnamed protein product [Rotaria socialis]CAF3346254.1 unnamed protein product [Rotaria socialis]CAF3460106.1 unnamed protein product [Rotaria socialis]CAF3464233.1 unnamed protein product [Rotaria socialis]CAF3639759.1 unnamed protein product [Rotaria socialis]
MPVIIRDINWEETDINLVLHIPMKGAKANKLDVLSSDQYLKVSFPPFFYEVFLYDFVNDDKSRIIVQNGFVEVTLTKQNPRKWNQLSHPQSENKEIMKALREEALNQMGLKQKQRTEANSSLLNANKREAVREQMKLEGAERNRIDTIKKNERDKISEEMKQFEENQKIQRQLAMQNHIKPNEIQLREENNGPENKKMIFEENKVIEKKKTIFEENTSKSSLPEPKLSIPLRETCRIAVNFTSRVFPTPLRESQTDIEEQWLRKQVESRQVSTDLQLDLSEKEKDIDYLKEKANQFFQQGNFQSAIGVYNHAIRVFPKVATLYSNRAACHFQVRNMMKCVEDCSRALELLDPPVPDNLLQRVKAHVRRGTAFCELELYAEGLLDYEAALKLSPDDEKVREDAQRIRNFLEKNQDFS